MPDKFKNYKKPVPYSALDEFWDSDLTATEFLEKERQARLPEDDEDYGDEDTDNFDESGDSED